jgi:hypothetical protein
MAGRHRQGRGEFDAGMDRLEIGRDCSRKVDIAEQGMFAPGYISPYANEARE